MEELIANDTEALSFIGNEVRESSRDRKHPELMNGLEMVNVMVLIQSLGCIYRHSS